MKSWVSDSWLKILVAILLVGAVYPSLPYVYYQLLSWVVLAAALSTAWQGRDNQFIVWFFLFIGVVFNPFAPLHLRQDIWHLADVCTALLFLGMIFFVRSPKEEPATKK